ncbi:MAG: HRDC domain-containing protein [Thermodesulforhabdaceae bacterium]
MDADHFSRDFSSCVGSSAVSPFSIDCIEVITTDDALSHLVVSLKGERQLAVDTESNGFYAYHEKTCLIQLSNGVKNYIIDPLSVKNCSHLTELFSDPNIEKILHHGVNDISGLKHDFGLSFVNIFDTSVACQLVGIKRRGLASLLSLYFGISINKKGQHYDWSRRPLDKNLLIYAAVDVFYLIPLAEKLKKELKKIGRLEKAWELSQAVASRIVPKRRFSVNGYLHMDCYKELDERDKKIVRRLYRLRDEFARQWDRAPFRVLSDDTIFRIVSVKPCTFEELEKVKGVPARLQRGQFGNMILKIVQEGIL